jgi:hypothetical protein
LRESFRRGTPFGSQSVTVVPDAEERAKQQTPGLFDDVDAVDPPDDSPPMSFRHPLRGKAARRRASDHLLRTL